MELSGLSACEEGGDEGAALFARCSCYEDVFD